MILCSLSSWLVEATQAQNVLPRLSPIVGSDTIRDRMKSAVSQIHQLAGLRRRTPLHDLVLHQIIHFASPGMIEAIRNPPLQAVNIYPTAPGLRMLQQGVCALTWPSLTQHLTLSPRTFAPTAYVFPPTGRDDAYRSRPASLMRREPDDTQTSRAESTLPSQQGRAFPRPVATAGHFRIPRARSLGIATLDTMLHIVPPAVVRATSHEHPTARLRSLRTA